MKPRLYSYVAILLASAVLVYSCKKGDTGPAGPAGPAGTAGAAGPQGPKGDTGTANVIYSAWLDAAFQVADTAHDLPDPNAVDTLDYLATFNAPKLTATILNQGVVKVYFNFGSAASPHIIELPFTDFVLGLNFSTQFVPGTIGVFCNLPLSTTTSNGAKIQQVRYVIIPGGVPASVNTKDYTTVKNYFKLPD
jgi:hypothetical protein